MDGRASCPFSVKRNGNLRGLQAGVRRRGENFKWKIGITLLRASIKVNVLLKDRQSQCMWGLVLVEGGKTVK